MAQTKTNPLIKVLAIPLIIIVGGILLLVLFSGHTQKPTAIKNSSFINDSASSDTPVETLKTLTSEISAVQQQNQQLVEQNKRLTEQDKTSLAQFKQDVMAQVQQQLTNTKPVSPVTTSNSSPSTTTANSNSTDNSTLTNTTENPSDNFIWVADLQTSDESKTNSRQKHYSEHQLADTETTTHSPAITNNVAITKVTATPYYTIPVNATLTGAIAMQPLIGRVPIDGKVPDPYTFKVIIGAKNLAANSIDIPPDIQGIVASGVAEGDMLGSCARGDITSLTFVFWDGRISTTEAKDSESLGTIAAANGNPCILGTFHSNAAIYLGAEAVLAGMQGYGNALSQSQLSSTTSDSTNTSISTLVGSANRYAFGQGFAASSQAAQRWWDQRVQNSFDFVYVPNVDPKTGKKLLLNINITQEIPIDYNSKGRKLFYDHENLSNVAAHLD